MARKPEARINKQTPAKSCGKCYQSDCYDDLNKMCSRCDELDMLGALGKPTEWSGRELNSCRPLDADGRRSQLLDEREQILDKRQERIGAREVALNERQRTLNEREEELDDREKWSNTTTTDNKSNIGIRVRAGHKWNVRFIGLAALVLVVGFIVISSTYYGSGSTASTTQLEPVLQTEIGASRDGKIPYKVELDSNPEKLTENPVVVLGVGNVTTLELEEAAKDILVGDKETVEAIKSSTNPKKVYLIGKAPIANSNIVIEGVASTTIFVSVVESTSVGGFNSQVKVISNKL